MATINSKDLLASKALSLFDAKILLVLVNPFAADPCDRTYSRSLEDLQPEDLDRDGLEEIHISSGFIGLSEVWVACPSWSLETGEVVTWRLSSSIHEDRQIVEGYVEESNPMDSNFTLDEGDDGGFSYR